MNTSCSCKLQCSIDTLYNTANADAILRLITTAKKMHMNMAYSTSAHFTMINWNSTLVDFCLWTALHTMAASNAVFLSLSPKKLGVGQTKLSAGYLYS